MFACPGSLVALQWDVDADSVSLRATPGTPDGPLPDHMPAARGEGGFRFRVANSDTTFELKAHRGMEADARASLTVRVAPGPFTENLAVPYDCGSRTWVAHIAAVSSSPPDARISAVTNAESFPIQVEYPGLALALGPGETHRVPALFPLTDSTWRVVRVDDSPRPGCPPPSGTGMPAPPEPLPGPIHVSVTLSCPMP